MYRLVGRRSALVAVATAALLALTARAGAEETKIVNHPLTPQEVEVTYHDILPVGTQVGTGLFTIGVGDAVYLEVLVDQGALVNNVIWSIDSQPIGSSATLSSSPLTDAIPIWAPGDRVVYEVAGGSTLGRRMLIPDAVGQYTISAAVDTGGIAVTASQIFTAATYVGVGTVGRDAAGNLATPAFPQCATCHADHATKWAATGHASKLEREITGRGSSHYNSGCIRCHTVGFNEAVGANNGGFDDVAADLGWMFPTFTDADGVEHPDLRLGNWDAMPPELQAKANIQCESCHGPGSEHGGNITENRISTSTSASTCGTCHDELPYHYRNQQWATSRHAVATRYPTGENRENCVVCHSGIGFIERIDKGIDITQADYGASITDPTWEAVTCQVCHDPHSEENPHQLRKVDQVELITGEIITQGGTGKLCMQCHKARRGGDEWAGVHHRRHDPHHSNQTDMLVGSTAAEFGKHIRSSSHVYAVEDGCAGCHMQNVPSSDPAANLAGDHTFKMVFDNGTPDNLDDDVDMTAPCVTCHGPMLSFDLPRDDFDGDGKIEGVQTEIEGLMHKLAMALPPVGQDAIALAEDFTEAQLKATFNYNFVHDDGSHGIHNPRYAAGILRESIQAVTGRRVVQGGQVRVLQPTGETYGLTVSGLPIGGTREIAGKLVPLVFGLGQNFPNPFNPHTEIHYAVPNPSEVRLDIYNSLGQKVRTLIEAYHAPGIYGLTWDGRNFNGQKAAPGVYIYTMQADNYGQSRKMLLLE